MTQSSIQTETWQALKQSRLVCLSWVLGFAVSVATVAEETPENNSQQIIPPDNWYQVEVILFTQQGNTGTEAPPLDYQLAFPENWQVLIDPRLTHNGSTPPIAEGALLSVGRFQDPKTEPQPRFIPRAQVEDPAISQFQGQRVEADAITLAAQRLAEAQALDQQLADGSAYQPRYEQPLLLLDSEFRDLNQSALALDRRGYNVVFHNAWRFASQGEENDPWLLIKAGQQLDDRHQIEGSLRFYRSRFVHFQSNLWLAQFSNDSTQLIELPDLPTAAQPELPTTQHSQDYYSNLASLQPMDIDRFQGLDMDNPASLEDLEGFERLEGLAGIHPQASQQLLELTNQQSAKPKQYPVTELWTLKKSMRLDENEVYYIDHPKMGIMLSIKSYEPVLLNPQPPAESVDRIGEEIGDLTSE